MKNTFNYKIYQNVYDAMISGRKNIEVRLLNEKSAKIKNGDEIIFSVPDSEKRLSVQVTNKYVFENVEELWKHRNIVLKSAIDYTKDEVENQLYEIFGKENVLNSKLVGIEFKINHQFKIALGTVL